MNTKYTNDYILFSQKVHTFFIELFFCFGCMGLFLWVLTDYIQFGTIGLICLIVCALIICYSLYKNQIYKKLLQMVKS